MAGNILVTFAIMLYRGCNMGIALYIMNYFFLKDGFKHNSTCTMLLYAHQILNGIGEPTAADNYGTLKF